MYHHNLIGFYNNITLCLVRVWTCIAALCSTVKAGNWDSEILAKWPYPLNTASNILLGVTACLSFSWLRFIAVFVKSKP